MERLCRVPSRCEISLGIEHEKVSAIATPLLGNEKYNSNLQLVAAHIMDVARLQGLMKTSKSDPD